MDLSRPYYFIKMILICGIEQRNGPSRLGRCGGDAPRLRGHGQATRLRPP